MPGHTEGIALAYDPKKARRLLAEGGYPGGRGFPTIKCWLMSVEPLNQIRYLQEQLLENLGIEVELHALSHNEMVYRLQSELPRMWVIGWLASYPDPHDFLGPRSWNSQVGWKNDDYKRLIAEARSLLDQSRRLQLYQQADRILIQQAAIVPIIYDRWRQLLKPWVRRFPTSGMKNWHWKDVIIEAH